MALALPVALLSLALLPAVTLAQDDPERQIEQLEEELRASQAREQRLQAEAETLAREIEDLRRRTVNAARLTQDTEDQLTELENRLIELHDEETRLRRTLEGQQDRMLAVLIGLQRLSLRPEESLLVQPAPLADTLRGAILLRAAVPELNDRVSTLRDELQRLHDVRAEIGRQHEAIGVTVNQLARQNNELEALLAQKTRLRSTTEAERAALTARAETLARDAADLRELVARLEEERREAERREAERLEAERREAEEIARVLAERAAARAAQLAASQQAAAQLAATQQAAAQQAADQQAAAQLAAAEQAASQQAAAQQAAAEQAAAQLAAAVPPPSLEESRGTMPLPARGTIVRRYGEAVEHGTARGLSIRTRPAAQVVAPADGQVVFAGAFRGYGLLLIIEHGGGYHTLLSGMSRVDVIVGQRLLSGEPVGTMDQDQEPTLYVELRRDNQPINPLPWLSARKG